MAKYRLSWLVLGLALVMTFASSAQAKEEPVLLRYYDVKDLVANRHIQWNREAKATTKVGMAELTNLIVKTIEPATWLHGRSTIDLVDDHRLEIRTTKDLHNQIADLLEALARVTDITFDVETDLYAIDRALYLKEFAPKLAEHPTLPIVLDAKSEKALRTNAQHIRSNKVTLNDHEKGQAFAFRRAIPYEWLAHHGAHKSTELAYVGIRLEVRPQVSADRRIVEMQLKQRGSELLAMRKQTKTDELGNAVKLSVPQVRHGSTTTNVRVGDGVSVLLPLLAPPPGPTDKDLVAVLLVRPSIKIGEEERLKKFGVPSCRSIMRTARKPASSSANRANLSTLPVRIDSRNANRSFLSRL